MANMKIELNMKGQNENFDMKGLLMKKKNTNSKGQKCTLVISL